MTQESKLKMDYMITPFLQIIQLILQKEVTNLFLGNKHILNDTQELNYLSDPLPYHNLAFSVDNHVGQLIKTDINGEIKWCLLYDSEIKENFSSDEYEVLRPFLSATMNQIEERMFFLSNCLHDDRMLENIRPEYITIVKEILRVHYVNHLNHTYNGTYASVKESYQVVMVNEKLFQLPIMVHVHQDYNDSAKICEYCCSMN